MNRLRSVVAILAAAVALAGVEILAQPSPPPADANVGCTVVTAPAGVVTEGLGAITGGAVGGGNPVGDACNSVTDGAVEAVTSPVKSALKGIAGGILGQITTWVSEGATWLMGEVVAEIDKTTTPKLTSEGFLSEYARMAQVASILAAAMFVMALFEAVVQGSWAVLGKAIFVSVPLAFVGTSVAFVLVQLMLVVTDGMSHAVTVATQEHSAHFFKSAMGDLSKVGQTKGGEAAAATQGPHDVVSETAQAGAVPLFVTCLAAIIGAGAALCVWVELLFRDAAVYVVVLFMPLAAAASISPRWAHILRRYIEVIATTIASKFVIVSVVALAASMISEEGAGIEHILAAGALLLVACFCPLLFFRLVLSMEAGVSAALSRRGAPGGAVTMMQMAGGPQGFASMARSNWSGPEVWSVKGDESGSGGGGHGAEKSPGFAPGTGPGEAGPGAGAAEAGAEAAGGSLGPVVAGAEAAADGARSTAHHLEQTGTAQLVGEEPPPSSPDSSPSTAGAGSPPAPVASDSPPVASSPQSSTGTSLPAPSPSAAGAEGGGSDTTQDQVPEREQGDESPRGPAESPPRPPEDLGGAERGGVDV